jgi:hypothetical protein
MPLLLARNNERLDVVKVLEEAIRQWRLQVSNSTWIPNFSLFFFQKQ